MTEQRAFVRMPCRVSRAWYRARMTRKADATFYMVRSGLTGSTTLVIEDAEGRKMQVELDPAALQWLVKLGTQWCNEVTT